MSLLEYKVIECLTDYMSICNSWKLINSCKTLFNNKKLFKIHLPHSKTMRWYTILYFDETEQIQIVPKVQYIDYDLINIMQFHYHVDYLPFFNKLMRMKYGYRNTKKVMKRINNHTKNIDIKLLPCRIIYDLIQCYYHIYNNQYILSYDIISNSINHLNVFSPQALVLYSALLYEWINTPNICVNEFKEKTLINCSLCILISEIIFRTKFEKLLDVSEIIDSLLSKLSECREIIIIDYKIDCEKMFDSLISRLSNKYKQIKIKNDKY